MIIWGWGKRTIKHLGRITQTCPYCKKTGWFQVMTIRSWFTIFFIPVIPYRVKHSMMCTNCGGVVELDAERVATAKHLIAGTLPLHVIAGQDDEWAAARERDAAYLNRVKTTTEAIPPTEAH